MTDDERLLAHARDLLHTAADDGYLTHTSFLDLRQRSLLQPLQRECGREVSLFFSGGYPDAERTLALFVPRYYGAASAEELASTSENLAAQSDVLKKAVAYFNIGERKASNAISNNVYKQQKTTTPKSTTSKPVVKKSAISSNGSKSDNNSVNSHKAGAQISMKDTGNDSDFEKF